MRSGMPHPGVTLGTLGAVWYKQASKLRVCTFEGWLHISSRVSPIQFGGE
jgi:hypothetical protein